MYSSRTPCRPDRKDERRSRQEGVARAWESQVERKLRAGGLAEGLTSILIESSRLLEGLGTRDDPNIAISGVEALLFKGT